MHGLVTPTGYGSCMIIASASYVSGIRDTCYVNVIMPVPEKKVTSVSLSASNLTVIYKQPGTVQISAYLLPEDAGNKTLYWESTDNSIATVDQYGRVSAINPGTCKIRACTTDGSDISAECEINVIYAQPTGIEIVEEFDQDNDVTVEAKNRLTDALVCDGVRAFNKYKVKLLPSYTAQGADVIWTLEQIENNPFQMVNLLIKSDRSVEITAKNLIHSMVNRGAFLLRAQFGGFTATLKINVFEKVPVQMCWGLWIDPENYIEREGIVPLFPSHSESNIPEYIPFIEIISSTGKIYRNPQPGLIWKDPFLPDNSQDFLNEFTGAFFSPAGEFCEETNCHYVLKI